MFVLGIETSCDETSAAVVEDGRRILSNVVSSQIALHQPFGGVVPEIASRQHVRAITLVAREALQTGGIEGRDLHLVAATYGPGLAGALLVGLNFGRGMALALGRPFVPVNHLEGHLHSVWLHDNGTPSTPPELPLLALVVSGGHTQLVLMHGHGDYELVGRTLDDAAGEAFDKVARVIGLPYPGGPAIQGAAGMAQHPIDLPRAWLPGTFDFSFSGLKTAVLHAAYRIAHPGRPEDPRRIALPRLEIAGLLSAGQRADIASGFQESVVDVLVQKTADAAEQFQVSSVAVVGGVAANKRLRERMFQALTVPVRVSAPALSTDNAAMIASAGYFVPREDDGVDAQPSLKLPVKGQLPARAR